MSIHVTISDLQSGLINGLGDGIWGVGLLDYVFEPEDGLEDPVEEILSPLPAITKPALTKEMKAFITKQFWDLIASCEEYKFAKDTLVEEDGHIPEHGRTVLYEFWEAKLETFTEFVIKDLQTESLAEPSMTIFVVATYVHLVVLQEMAHVDPTEEIPGNSEAATLIVDCAQKYLTHFIPVYNKYLEARKAAITDFQATDMEEEDAQYWKICWGDNFSRSGYEDRVFKDNTDPECLRKGILRLKKKYTGTALSYLRDCLPFEFGRVTHTLELLRKDPIPFVCKTDNNSDASVSPPPSPNNPLNFNLQ